MITFNYHREKSEITSDIIETCCVDRVQKQRWRVDRFTITFDQRKEIVTFEPNDG